MKKATNQQIVEAYNRTGSVWKAGEELGMCGQSVWERLRKLGFVDKDAWTDAQIAILRAAYGTITPSAPVGIDELAKILGKHKTNVCRKARELGLATSRHRTKTEEQRVAMGQRTKNWIKEHGHPRGAYKGGKDMRICPSCGRFFEAFPSSKQMYCCQSCGHKFGQSEGNQGYSKSGRRADLGNQYFRSRWEANYARYLNFLINNDSNCEITNWEYEKETFEFHKIKKGTRFYTPDFKVHLKNGGIEYHEVKGWDYPKGRTARKRFAKYYPQHKLILLDKDFFKELVRKGIDKLIDNWEYETRRKTPSIDIKLDEDGE
jgi:hypothetical protein